MRAVTVRVKTPDSDHTMSLLNGITYAYSNGYEITATWEETDPTLKSIHREVLMLRKHLQRSMYTRVRTWIKYKFGV